MSTRITGTRPPDRPDWAPIRDGWDALMAWARPRQDVIWTVFALVLAAPVGALVALALWRTWLN